MKFLSRSHKIRCIPRDGQWIDIRKQKDRQQSLFRFITGVEHIQAGLVKAAGCNIIRVYRDEITNDYFANDSTLVI